MKFGNTIIDIMAQAKAAGIEISEITLEEAQVDALAIEHGTRWQQGMKPPAEMVMFNGVRIVVRPSKTKSLADQLRALAKQVEDTLK